MQIDRKCIGLNMIGKVISVKGHISCDLEEEVSGVVLSTTAGGWCGGLNAALFLVMYEDGKVHWEDLTNEQTKNPTHIASTKTTGWQWCIK